MLGVVHGERRGGDRIAVRIDRGVAEHLVHALDQAVRHGVLESLRFGVHLAPVHPHHFHEEELDQAVTPDHVKRELAPRLREPDAAVRLVVDEVAVGERFHHRGDRARGDREHLRDPPGGDALAARRLLLEQDLLQVVLDGRGRHARPA
jgi:hypothetical protein